MSGTVGDLSPKQSELLQKFRENVNDILKPHYDDHFLLRWLRARNFDLKKSETMLRNHVEWRRKFGIDTIKEDFDPPEVLKKYEGGGLFGLDKDGCPIWFYPLGRLDPKGLLRSAKKIHIIKFMVLQLEMADSIFKEESKKQGKLIDRLVIIHDMDQFGMRHLWKPGVELFNDIMTIYEDQYPEMLKYAIVINAPKFFPLAFNLVKPFLSAETIKKTKILGRNYKQELQKYINADNLPAHYGGTCYDPDGDAMCSSKINYAGEIPKSYRSQQLSSEDMENFTSVTVKQGSYINIDVDVPLANSALRWQFTTNGFDINFGVYMRKTGGAPEDLIEVVPSDRVNSHLFPEDGIITCKNPGTYVLKFDNSYSWVRSKKMSYLVEVLKPDENMDLPSDLVATESSYLSTHL